MTPFCYLCYPSILSDFLTCIYHNQFLFYNTTGISFFISFYLISLLPILSNLNFIFLQNFTSIFLTLLLVLFLIIQFSDPLVIMLLTIVLYILLVTCLFHLIGSSCFIKVLVFPNQCLIFIVQSTNSKYKKLFIPLFPNQQFLRFLQFLVLLLSILYY